MVLAGPKLQFKTYNFVQTKFMLDYFKIFL